MKKLKNSKLLASLLCVAILCIPALAADPGSSDDPLVSLSYVNDVLIPQFKSYVDAAIDEQYSKDMDTSFNVVNVSKGQMILGAKRCQMILRMGDASVVATQKGGIADVTDGVDLANGVKVPSNHLLIVPLDDGRGVMMKTDGILMISGSYTVN